MKARMTKPGKDQRELPLRRTDSELSRTAWERFFVRAEEKPRRKRK